LHAINQRTLSLRQLLDPLHHCDDIFAADDERAVGLLDDLRLDVVRVRRYGAVRNRMG
jgi:hypothetical protein